MELFTISGIHEAQDSITPDLLTLRASEAFVKNYYAALVVKDKIFQWFYIFVCKLFSSQLECHLLEMELCISHFTQCLEHVNFTQMFIEIKYPSLITCFNLNLECVLHLCLYIPLAGKLWTVPPTE